MIKWRAGELIFQKRFNYEDVTCLDYILEYLDTLKILLSENWLDHKNKDENAYRLDIINENLEYPSFNNVFPLTQQRSFNNAFLFITTEMLSWISFRKFIKCYWLPEAP